MVLCRKQTKPHLRIASEGQAKVSSLEVSTKENFHFTHFEYRSKTITAVSSTTAACSLARVDLPDFDNVGFALTIQASRTRGSLTKRASTAAGSCPCHACANEVIRRCVHICRRCSATERYRVHISKTPEWVLLFC